MRRHTEASLFNVLLRRLREGRALQPIQSAEDLETADFGSLVELSGEIVGNPIQHLVVLAARVIAMAGLSVEQVAKGKIRSQKDRQAAASAGLDSEALEGFALLLGLGIELLNASVRDVLLETSGDFKGVLTLSSEFIDEETEEQLDGGRSRIIGKVTHLVRDDQDSPINLTRRTDLRLLEDSQAETVIRDACKAVESPIHLREVDPIISSPAVQVLPLAIYI